MSSVDKSLKLHLTPYLHATPSKTAKAMQIVGECIDSLWDVRVWSHYCTLSPTTNVLGVPGLYLSPLPPQFVPWTLFSPSPSPPPPTPHPCPRTHLSVFFQSCHITKRLELLKLRRIFLEFPQKLCWSSFPGRVSDPRLRIFVAWADVVTSPLPRRSARLHWPTLRKRWTISCSWWRRQRRRRRWWWADVVVRF